MKIINKNILQIQLTAFLLFVWNLSFADNILLHEKFNGKKDDLKGWKFTPDTSWSVLSKIGAFGDGGLAVTGGKNSNIKKYEASLSMKLNPGGKKTLRLSVWLKTENVNYRRDAIVEIQFKGTRYFQEIREFNRNKEGYSYLEKVMKVPADLSSATINIIFYGQTGTAYIDEIKLEDVSGKDKSQLWTTNSTPYKIERKAVLGKQTQWNTNLPYRITGKLDADYSGDPVWTDLDFSRLLLASGELNPVDPSSVRLFAKYGNGKTEECPVSFGDPIAKLSDHYMRNGTLKWRAKRGAVEYEIYFASAGKNGPLPQQKNLHLGVGELLNYPANDKNLLWAGWPGYGLEVLDVDGDGDWDIYGKTVDGGTWLHRNIGSNQSPLFLPRSRQLKTDKDPTDEPEDFMIDWDGDGYKDRVYYVKHPRSNRTDNIEASVYVQLHRNGKLSKEVLLTYTDGKPVKFINSSWFSMKTGDFNNDGKPDLVIGSTQGYAEILLNKGLKNDKPVVVNEKLPLNVFKKEPYESGDMSLKPFPIDWDGDGRTDLVFTAWQGFYWISFNKGKKDELKFENPKDLYQQGGLLVHSDSPAPYAVDWDNDGDLDIISGGCSGNLMYYENIAGKGNPPQFKAGIYLRDDTNERFFVNAVKEGGTVQGMEEQYWGYLTVVPADVDKDGDLDLIIADCLGKVRWIENIGNKSNPKLSRKIHDFIVNGKPLITPWRNRPGVADWNNDNRLELILLNDDSELVFYSQDAKNPSLLYLSGNLKDKNGKNILIKRPPARVPGGNGRLQIDVADWDGDGNLDLIMGEPRMYLGGGNLTICLNKGTNLNPVFEYSILKARGGRFVEWTGSDGHDAWHCTYPCVVDWNNDGKPDLLTGTESGRFAFYANDYFKGEKFPVFTALEFDVREDNQSISRILDFKSLTPFTAGLNTHNVQLQLLPEESNLNLINAQGTLNITSPEKAATVSGKVKFIATVSYPNPVSVDFYINNEKVATESSPPYVAFGDDNFWDTTKYPDGECNLKVVLHLFDGRKIEVTQTNIVRNKK
ncbi:FG-GAP-like repeat-containing protein [Pseudopedobacter beijingensis]|uniref:FG-GAP-like repeat-containing protein n=1 Tax=Pseudopedobacter beijingensis TaxID=1207056 RepID=A0ABW4IHU1_9SPHI